MISILMPTYNCAKYITSAIQSVLNQTFVEFEFLIIDDGSTDDSENIISKLKDDRIKYVKKQHSGLGDSLNYGLQIAQNDIIARMDADDIALPNRFEKQLLFHKANPHIDVVSCWYAIFANSKIKYIVKTPTEHQEIVKGLTLYSYISHPGCLYNRNTILKFGGYNSEVFEDYELWLRRRDELKFAIIPEVLILQRYRDDSLSHRNIKGKNSIHYQIQQRYFDSLSSNFNIRDSYEENSIRGWREYFYGSAKLARNYWIKSRLKLLLDYRMLLAFMVSFLPKTVFIEFKESNLSYRLNYLFQFYSKEFKQLRRQLIVSIKN